MSNVKQCIKLNHCRLKIQGFPRNVNQRGFSRSLKIYNASCV
jgi:hypothetical protein